MIQTKRLIFWHDSAVMWREDFNKAKYKFTKLGKKKISNAAIKIIKIKLYNKRLFWFLYRPFVRANKSTETQKRSPTTFKDSKKKEWKQRKTTTTKNDHDNTQQVAAVIIIIVTDDIIVNDYKGDWFYYCIILQSIIIFIIIIVIIIF